MGGIAVAEGKVTRGRLLLSGQQIVGPERGSRVL
jgi:hypothetical protein